MDEAALRRLACFRIGLGVLFLAKLQQTRASITRLAEIPESWRPVSWALAMPSPPTPADATLLYAVAFTAGLLFLAGLWTRWAGPVLVVAGSLAFSVLYSFGKIGHGNNLLLLTLLVVSFAPAGHRYSIDAWLHRRQGFSPRSGDAAWVPTVAAFAAGLIYFSSGAIKVALGEFLAPGNLANILQKRAELAGGPIASWVPPVRDSLLSHPGLLEVLGYAAVALEMSIILAWTGVRLRTVLMASLVMFHAFIALFMGLAFGANLYIVAMLGLWAGLELRDRRGAPALGPWTRAPTTSWRMPLITYAVALVGLMATVWVTDLRFAWLVRLANPTLVDLTHIVHHPIIWSVAWFGGGVMVAWAVTAAGRAWWALLRRPAPIDVERVEIRAHDAWATRARDGAPGLPAAAPATMTRIHGTWRSRRCVWTGFQAVCILWTLAQGNGAWRRRLVGHIGMASPLGEPAAWLYQRHLDRREEA